MIRLVGAGRGAGFFDVDETLVGMKTMFDFLHFYLERCGGRPGTYDVAMRRLRRAAAEGSSRAEINRMYYRLYEGERVRHLQQAGRDWADRTLARDDIWLPACGHVRAFTRAGAFTALISDRSSPAWTRWPSGWASTMRAGRRSRYDAVC